jgi:hypothetical protein
MKQLIRYILREHTKKLLEMDDLLFNKIKNDFVMYPDEKTLFLAIKKSAENNGYTCEQGNTRVLNGAEIDIWIPEIEVGFEYQGDDHYRYVSKLTTDVNKRKIAKKRGIIIINYPFYFGWDNQYFDFLAEKRMKFDLPNSPFGFISTQDAFPSSFSYQGIERFINEVDSLPEKLQKQIIISLMNRQNERYYYDINDDIPNWNSEESYDKDMVVRHEEDYYIARRKTNSNPQNPNSDWGIYLFPERKTRGIYDIIPKNMEDWYLEKLYHFFGYELK